MKKRAVLDIVKVASQMRTKTRTDTIIINHRVIESWKAPPFQRALRVNEKVRMLALVIKDNDGVVPGVVTLGLFDGHTYLLDAQHRVHAFILSGLEEGFADVRIIECESMAQMGQEFVNLNSRLVNFKPDDILRGLEASTPPLLHLRERCPFVGYDMVRRGPAAPVVSMSMVLRVWSHSSADTPAGGSTMGAAHLAQNLTADEAETIAAFLSNCHRAWGRDAEYYRLWGALNLTICAWLYRRTVLSQYSAKTPHVTREQFTRGLMRLSADGNYMDWLVGRLLNERDRSPCYQRIKAIFARTLEEETGEKVRLPQPPWSGGK